MSNVSLSLLGAALALTSQAAAAQAIDPTTVSERLLLEAHEDVQVSLAGVPGGPVSAVVLRDGVEHWIELEPTSVRSAAFRLIEQRADGSYADLAAEAPTTYRGVAPTLGAAEVAASWLDGGLHARLMLADGSSLWLEPLAGRVENADAYDYVLYGDEDVADHGGLCGVGEREQNAVDFFPTPTPLDDEAVAFGSSLEIAELGIDCDFEYFQDYGSVANTQAQVESIINTMNLQYENQVGITHEITTIIVRTTSNDPYSSTSPFTLLDQFVNHWNTAQSGVQRDVAQLFTGKNIQGGVIGIAYLSAVCSNLAYGLVESDCCGSFASKTDLSAHELGHNWSAGHCNCANPPFTMNPFIVSANNFNPSITVPAIVNFANSIPCLDTGPGGGGGCQNVAYGESFGGANIGTLGSTDEGQLGTTWTGEFSGFDAFATGRFLASGSQATVPFGGGTILLDFQNATADLTVTTGANGSGTVDVPVPANPSLAGLSAFTQVGMFDSTFPGGYAFSNGLQVTFCN